MGALLIILQIIGALPGVIAAFKKLWDYIKEIKDTKLRNKLKNEHRALVFKAMKQAYKNPTKKMSADQNESILNEVDALDRKVQIVLLNQK